MVIKHLENKIRLVGIICTAFLVEIGRASCRERVFRAV